MKRIFSVSITAALMGFSILWGMGNAEAAGFGTVGNQLTVETDAAAYILAIGTDGIVSPVGEMQGATLSAIRIGLVNSDTQVGSYPMELGIVVADTRNSRRLEAFVTGIQAEVSPSGVTVTIPAGASMRFAGRSVDGMTEIASTITNLQADGPITGANDSLIFNLAGLQQRLVESFPPGSASGELALNILSTGPFAYTILIKSPVSVGHVDGAADAFTAFPSFNIGPYGGEYGANLARLLESPIAKTDYLDGICHVIRGSFGVGAGNFAPAAGDAPTLNPGGGVVPQPGSITDGSTVTTDVTNTGTVNDITIAAGILVNNTGVINNMTLQAGASITGGTVSGTIAGQGTGAEITNALIDGVSITNVTIGFGCRVTSQTVESNAGLDLTAAVTGPDGLVDPAAPLLVTDDGDLPLSLADLIAGEIDDIDDASPNGSCHSEIDDDSHTAVFSSGQVAIPGRIRSVATTDQEDGIGFIEETGEVLIVREGIAITLGPASADPLAFSAAIQGLGLESEEDEHLVLTIGLPDGTRLSVRFDILALRPGAVATLAAAGASFSVTGNPSNPEDYYLMVTYPDGTTQKMPPFIHALGMFKSLAQSAGVAYRVIPSTGVIELLGLAGEILYRGLPDYLLGNPDGTPTGISFESAGDANGDGLPDVRMITPTATQIIFSLP